MEPKQFILIGFSVLFLIINLPEIFLALKVVTYSVTIFPSIVASCITYYYYACIPDTQYTLLTSAAKSVIAWHAVLSVSVYTYLSVATIYWEELLDSFNTDGNFTCYLSPLGSMLELYPATAIAEFQLLRIFFQFWPYGFLALNHDFLGTLLALSVPLIAGSVQLFMYLTQGTLCTKVPIIFLHYRLDMKLKTDEVFFTNLRPEILIILIIVVAEILVRLYRFLKRKKSIAPLQVQNVEAGMETSNKAEGYSI